MKKTIFAIAVSSVFLSACAYQPVELGKENYIVAQNNALKDNLGINDEFFAESQFLVYRDSNDYKDYFASLVKYINKDHLLCQQYVQSAALSYKTYTDPDGNIISKPVVNAVISEYCDTYTMKDGIRTIDNVRFEDGNLGELNVQRAIITVPNQDTNVVYNQALTGQ